MLLVARPQGWQAAKLLVTAHTHHAVHALALQARAQPHKAAHPSRTAVARWCRTLG